MEENQNIVQSALKAAASPQITAAPNGTPVLLLPTGEMQWSA